MTRRDSSVGDYALEREFRIRALQLRRTLEQIVTRHEKLDHQRLIEALIARRRFFDRGHDRLQLCFRIGEFIVKFDDLIERRGLLFRLPGKIEKR